jgi:hypothetical protein
MPLEIKMGCQLTERTYQCGLRALLEESFCFAAPTPLRQYPI